MRNNKIRFAISLRRNTKELLQQLKEEMGFPSMDKLILWLLDEEQNYKGGKCEQMKKSLKIEDFEDKTSKAGKPYTRFQTSEGWMSAFEADTISAIKQLNGKVVSVEVAESGEFKNIRKCYGVVAGQEAEVVRIAPAVSKPNNSTTMYVSYAKDLVVSGMNVEEAIGAIEQIKEAFS